MRRKFLVHPTEPIEVWPEKKISELTNEMLGIGFQGRKLAETIEIWSRMLKRKNLVIWFGLAGAMVPAGMRKIISYFIKRRMIDVLVTTGANMYHDFCEAMGMKHFIGTHMIDDHKLRKMRVDRIYDVFADEKKFYKLDNIISGPFSMMLEDNYPYSSREIFELLGKFLSKYGKEKNSIIISAYKNGVPIFCPAFGDSCIGFSLMIANRRKKEKTVKFGGELITLQKKNIIIDCLKDVHETARIREKTKYSGVIYIGGGTPKNFIQQTAIIASYQTRHEKSHNFAIQITTDSPQWGGLSGCTFEEAISWGKESKGSRMATCYADATIALPIISHSLSERFKKLRRNVPVFYWEEKDLKIKFEKMTL
ncbi:MAG: deoxyhypusine synthase [Candidatus Aenigmatarchaeota archaeon]